jgi:hypothetical protein
MTTIDFTAQMAWVGIGAVALLAIATAGIVCCLDERERNWLRAAAARVGWPVARRRELSRPARRYCAGAVSVR